MKSCVVLVTRACALATAAALLLAWSGCDRGGQSSEHPAAAHPPAPQAAAPTTIPRQALPRSVAGITLGMSRAAAEAKLGHLACHPGKASCEVCDPATEQGGEIHHLELYLHHDQVISVSYEEPPPANEADTLNQLIDRYGSPSLSGIRERDRSGRVHEIYGWKDNQSLYSVRFMWRDAEAGGRELLGTVTALWDRQGYQLWESETQPPGAPPAKSGEGQEPV
jgi:hypothetical protein